MLMDRCRCREVPRCGAASRCSSSDQTSCRLPTVVLVAPRRPTCRIVRRPPHRSATSQRLPIVRCSSPMMCRSQTPRSHRAARSVPSVAWRDLSPLIARRSLAPLLIPTEPCSVNRSVPMIRWPQHRLIADRPMSSPVGWPTCHLDSMRSLPRSRQPLRLLERRPRPLVSQHRCHRPPTSLLRTDRVAVVLCRSIAARCCRSLVSVRWTEDCSTRHPFLARRCRAVR